VPALLEAADLRVRRGRRTVLDGIGLALSAGDVVHLRGGNGAGKTSLLRVLAGLAQPARGTLVRRGACAFVPERVVLAPVLRPREWLGAMRGLRGLTPVDWDEPAAASGLAANALDGPAGTLSKGTLQRVALLEATRSGAPLLLLDEPFSSLDADGRGWLAAELAARAQEGAAVLLTDHAGDAGGRLELTAAIAL
jgi:heme exporter protein A